YCARDTRFHRDVALKVLPDAFAADVDRLARFEREAQVLASLNHPHIAAIYGVEEAGAVRALVLELVPRATRSRNASPLAVPCRSTMRCRSRGRSPMPSKPRTSTASFTAI